MVVGHIFYFVSYSLCIWICCSDRWRCYSFLNNELCDAESNWLWNFCGRECIREHPYDFVWVTWWTVSSLDSQHGRYAIWLVLSLITCFKTVEAYHSSCFHIWFRFFLDILYTKLILIGLLISAINGCYCLSLVMQDHRNRCW